MLFQQGSMASTRCPSICSTQSAGARTYPPLTAFCLRAFLNHRSLKGPFQNSLAVRVDTAAFVRFLPFWNVNVKEAPAPGLF